MSLTVKRDIPLLLASIVVIVTLLAFFFVFTPLKTASSTLTSWSVVIYSFFLWFGTVSLTLHHGRNTLKRGKEWPYSILLLAILWLYIVVGLGLGRTSSAYETLYFAFCGGVGVGPRMLLIFWITSATYRAFRAKSVEGAILLISGLLVVVGNAPIFSAIWPGFTAIRAWIMLSPSAGGLRPVVICSGLAIIQMGIRIILGYERTYLGVER